ncbi:hypothetical protein [uncultured Thiodictyon sp.]|uniref:alpha/beta hydrolase family protein n=1 Tax=uncultured Thiodictyon sp. TaxID=1846217 RepID=UPI0025D3050F|nr:hypothetical protein [uncultured Thiodictyon sp.]
MAATRTLRLRLRLPLLLIGGLGVGGLAAAKGLSHPWAPAYTAAARTSTSAPQPPRSYPDARYLIASEFLERLTQDTVAAARNLVAAALLVDPVKLPDGSSLTGFAPSTQGADLYRITYHSVDATGKPTVVSGLVAVPESGRAAGLVVYLHATTAERHNAPSDRSLEAWGVLTAFSGNEWVVALPDYLGYGVNHDPHPFALGRLNAPAGRDMIHATRELLSQLKRQADTALYVTGYSEGGGNALWLGRLLDEGQDPALRPTFITAMSGPYDITGATVHSFLQAQPAYVDNLTEKPFFIAFSAVAAAQVTGQPLSALLRPAFARETADLLPGTQADDVVEARLLGAAVADMAYLRLPDFTPEPTRLMQPDLIRAIETGDHSNPTVKLWAANDNLDWTPVAPVYLLGVIQDAVVPFAGRNYPLPAAYGGIPAPYGAGNTENAIRHLRARQLDHTRVGWMGFDGAVPGLPGAPLPTMSHDEAFVPCSILAARSFRVKGLAELPRLPDPK